MKDLYVMNWPAISAMIRPWTVVLIVLLTAGCNQPNLEPPAGMYAIECSLYASALRRDNSDQPLHVEPGRVIITSEGSTQLWDCPPEKNAHIELLPDLAAQQSTPTPPPTLQPIATVSPPTPTPITRPTVIFDPVAIETAFKANVHKALQDYNGQWVEAYETIHEIRPHSLLFTSTVTGYLTWCQPMPGQEAKLAALSVGQRITVWGEISMELGFDAADVSLQNCLIVSS